MSKKQTTDTVRKLLSLVPVLYANQGIRLEEIKKIAGYNSISELANALNSLILFGQPPFTPADFIDLYIDDDERVYLTFPQGLDRPLDLTTDEWIELHGAVARAMSRRDHLHYDIDQLKSLTQKFSAIPLEIETSRPFDSKYNLILEAIQENLQLEFTYRSLSSKEGEIRRVDPWTVFTSAGSAYMIGFCHLREAARYFHLERMADPVILDLERENPPPENLDSIVRDSAVFKENQGKITVQVEFKKEATAQAYRIFHPDSMEIVNYREQENWYRASFKIPDRLWFFSIMKTFGTNARIVGPAHLKESFLNELKQIPLPASL